MVPLTMPSTRAHPVAGQRLAQRAQQRDRPGDGGLEVEVDAGALGGLRTASRRRSASSALLAVTTRLAALERRQDQRCGPARCRRSPRRRRRRRRGRPAPSASSVSSSTGTPRVARPTAAARAMPGQLQRRADPGGQVARRCSSSSRDDLRCRRRRSRARATPHGLVGACHALVTSRLQQVVDGLAADDQARPARRGPRPPAGAADQVVAGWPSTGSRRPWPAPRAGHPAATSAGSHASRTTMSPLSQCLPTTRASVGGASRGPRGQRARRSRRRTARCGCCRSSRRRR